MRLLKISLQNAECIVVRTVGPNSIYSIAIEEEETTVDDDEALVDDFSISISISLFISFFFCEPQANCEYIIVRLMICRI